MMKILGLDLGSKNIGVAISDDLFLIAQSLTSIEKTSPEKDLLNVLYLVYKYQVKEIVVGISNALCDTKKESVRNVKEFIEKLNKALSINIILWDEGLSTLAVGKKFLKRDMNRKKRRKEIDQLSASIILQGYLDSRPR